MISRSWRPGEAEERFLRAAFGSAPPPAAGDLEQAPIDMLPLLYRTLTAADAPGPELGRLKGVYRRAWYGNQVLLARAGEAVEGLRAADIDALVLGGAAVGLLHYRDAGVRSMSDTRIAVRPGELTRAAAAVEGAGWHEPPVTGLDDDLWEARVLLALGERPAHAPAATDQLVRACAHGVAWSRRPRSWRWVADALTILRSDLDWQRVVDAAGRRRVARQLHLGLGYLRESFSAPVPEPIVDELRTAAGPLDVARLQLSRGRAFVMR